MLFFCKCLCSVSDARDVAERAGLYFKVLGVLDFEVMMSLRNPAGSVKSIATH